MKSIECVKVGLALLELFSEPEDRIKEIIRRLGLYDEFTIFSVWNMQKWENGNSEIFSLAQKTHSWGRIHAVERLEPETDEIRHWLLTEGTVNDVVNAYSSLTCWQKSGAEEILFGNPTQEDFKGIVTLVEGLLDEGPVPGISELENAESILLRFLELAPEYSPGINEYETILSVREWAEDEDVNLSSVSKAGDSVLHSPLKNRLKKFAAQHPDLCNLKEENKEYGSVSYTIQKSRVSIRLLVPYSEARRKTASEYAKKNSIIVRAHQGKLAKSQEL